jgi:Flp pilus assembly CpaF family ATPase
MEESSHASRTVGRKTSVFIARGGRAELTCIELTDIDEQLRVQRIMQSSGRRVGVSSPFVVSSSHESTGS